MSLRRIYSEQPLRAGTLVSLRGDAASHVARVLRLRPGDELVVFDGSGRDYDGQITDLRGDEVGVQLGSAREILCESNLELVLLQGICRGSRMDTVVQKVTELGVHRIVPVLAQRSVVRLADGQAMRKLGHWRRIAIAAAEQSGRSRIPEILDPAPFETAVAVAGASGVATRLLLDPAGSRLRELPPPASPLALLVGPEGGLSDPERDMAAASGFIAVRLGPRILRTETAPIAALAVLQFLAGDF